jgi:hypothetical protein
MLTDGMRMFGVMDLTFGSQGCRFAIGLRSSHDKSFRISAEQLWVNPDCGLKRRKWEEVRPALATMVGAARKLRTVGTQ